MFYGIQHIAARVYNPGRREAYERLGLTTVTSTSWGRPPAGQLILHPNVIDMEQIGHGEVRLLRIQAPESWCNRRVTEVLDGNGVVCAIARDGKAFVPPPAETLKTGDHVYLSIPSSRLDEILASIQTQ